MSRNCPTLSKSMIFPSISYKMCWTSCCR